jgi:hypothetical protein
MKNKLFRKHASVIPTGAPTLRSGQAARNGGIPSFGRFLATLGMTVLFCWSATAQNGVTVSNLAVHAGTVTFNVSWKKADMPALWSDSVWVFVDYNHAGRMERLPVTNATATAGTVSKVQGNDKGVWVIGNARSAGSFSATVQLRSTIVDVAGACAYASNYPPVGEYTATNKIEFTGTPPYNLVLAAECGAQSYTYSTHDSYYKLHNGETLLSFTDKTGASGRLLEMPYAPPPFAISASTYSLGSQIWSDRVYANTVPCELKSTTLTKLSTPQYIIRTEGTYYNWYCIDASAHILCPSPWRVPTEEDLLALRDAVAATTTRTTLGTGGRIASGYTTISNENDMALIQARCYSTYTAGKILLLGVSSSYSNLYWGPDNGTIVRCVR